MRFDFDKWAGHLDLVGDELGESRSIYATNQDTCSIQSDVRLQLVEIPMTRSNNAMIVIALTGIDTSLMHSDLS